MRAGLDSTSSRGRMARPATAAAAAASAVAAGEEADYYVAERDYTADDGVEDTANARDDRGQAVTDSTENGLDARDDGAHFCGCVVCWAGGLFSDDNLDGRVSPLKRFAV